jgi:hypothetical protein
VVGILAVLLILLALVSTVVVVLLLFGLALVTLPPEANRVIGELLYAACSSTTSANSASTALRISRAAEWYSLPSGLYTRQLLTCRINRWIDR